MNFTDLGLMPTILSALTKKGYDIPTPIQEGAIPPALQGRDVLGIAQTGTGKTCAFAAPILQRLAATAPKNPRVIRALIITPTRELALQIQENFEEYGKGLNLRSAVIFGGVGQAPQVDKIKRGLDILVATPGRLIDLQGQKVLDLSRVEIFVLDEADRMLDMGFIHDVKRILKMIPEKKQTLFFSATMPPEVTELVNSLLHSPAKIAVTPISSPVEVIEQSLYFVDKANKTKLLADIVRTPDVKNALVFSRTKHGANKIAEDLNKAHITAAAIHGNKSQSARQQALADFKEGRIQVLVATDIAARGIDIEELTHVVNYNLPDVPETYVHRIGRTGRAGHEGTAISFCDFGEKDDLKGIERLLGKKLPVVEGHAYPMEVFEVPAKAVPMPRGSRSNQNAGGRLSKSARNAPPEKRPNQDREQTPAKQNKTIREQKPVKSNPARGAAGHVPNTHGTVHRGLAANAPKFEDSQYAKAPEPRRNDRSWEHPDPLAGDRIMDATARLLAPRKPAAQPAERPQHSDRRPQHGERDNRKNNRDVGVGGIASTRQKAVQPPMAKGMSNPTHAPKAPEGKFAPKPGMKSQNNRRGGRPQGGGRRPPEVTLRNGSQKDSTEQASLMKPYY
ncbi:MAG: DEAD/DEAH box helicase, partial [Oscillospiraceae bacterium]